MDHVFEFRLAALLMTSSLVDLLTVIRGSPVFRIVPVVLIESVIALESVMAIPVA
ncbi:MAG: hypothetical protein GXY42_05370 [Desulfovibrionales bacterium]|nr:hypothetical protein [Desulfovibrionales bacterium]